MSWLFPNTGIPSPIVLRGVLFNTIVSLTNSTFKSWFSDLIVLISLELLFLLKIGKPSPTESIVVLDVIVSTFVSIHFSSTEIFIC